MRLTLRRCFLAAAAAALVLLAIPTMATTAGQISLYGGASGSSLELSAGGGRLIVEGHMANARPKGCHVSADRQRAVCPLRQASFIEVTMGPSNDFVRVKNALPLPLVVHLGDGSDKFIGNAERDTCYSEGSRRNRCTGGPGDDICITGFRNSDCVGGPGNDLCRHYHGSDGCWGGPGDDVCIMGPGQDGCHGEEGNDRLYGGRDPDRLYGGPGWDYCDGGPGRGKSRTCDAGPRR